MTVPKGLFKGNNLRSKSKYLLFILLIMLGIALVTFATKGNAYAEASSNEAEDKLNESIDGQLEAIDFGELEAITESISDSFSGEGFYERVRKILNGDFSEDSESFLQALMSLLLDWIVGQVPLFLTIGAIAVLGGIVTDMKTKSLLSGTSETVFYAIYILIILLTISGVYSVYDMVYEVVSSLRVLTEAIMPILLTLMTALGAGVSAAVYKPTVAFFSYGVLQLTEVVILPLFIVSVVFTVVSNFSKNVRLGKLSDFFGTLSTRITGTVFMIFSAFLTVRGITAGISDGISFKAARFAARNYIPIIGGFVSDGMDLFLAGTVLIKNAIGAAGVFVLFALVFVPVIKTAVFGLLMRLTASVIEPIADPRISGFLSGIAKRLSVLNVALIASGAMLLILLMLVIITSNTIVGA